MCVSVCLCVGVCMHVFYAHVCVCMTSFHFHCVKTILGVTGGYVVGESNECGKLASEDCML